MGAGLKRSSAKTKERASRERCPPLSSVKDCFQTPWKATCGRSLRRLMAPSRKPTSPPKSKEFSIIQHTAHLFGLPKQNQKWPLIPSQSTTPPCAMPWSPGLPSHPCPAEALAWRWCSATRSQRSNRSPVGAEGGKGRTEEEKTLGGRGSSRFFFGGGLCFEKTRRVKRSLLCIRKSISHVSSGNSYLFDMSKKQ